jgi:hypothetical protein
MAFAAKHGDAHRASDLGIQRDNGRRLAGYEMDPGSIAGAGVLGVGGEVHAHEDVGVGFGLHIHDVVRETSEFDETAFSEGADGDFAFAIEFGLKMGQPAVAGDGDHFPDEVAGESEAAIGGMGEGAHHANVAFPPAVPLLEGGKADEGAVGEGQEREAGVEVDVVAPVFGERGIVQALFDKKALQFGHLVEEVQEGGVVPGLLGADEAGFVVFQWAANRVVVEGKF